MRKVYVWGVLAVASALIGSVVASAQAPAPKPGPEVARLKAMEGTWVASVKMSEGPESKGTMVYKMDLGGMWLVSDFQGSFGGMKFQGKGLDTYDPVTKKYIGVWVDSMSSTPMTMQGDYDADAKVMTMTGEARGPDGKPYKAKTVTEMKDKDNMVFTMFGPGPDGKEGAMMTITYKRAGNFSARPVQPRIGR